MAQHGRMAQAILQPSVIAPQIPFLIIISSIDESWCPQMPFPNGSAMDPRPDSTNIHMTEHLLSHLHIKQLLNHSQQTCCTKLHSIAQLDVQAAQSYHKRLDSVERICKIEGKCVARVPAKLAEHRPIGLVLAGLPSRKLEILHRCLGHTALNQQARSRQHN